MDAKGSLFYALGQLSYAIANADGKVQKEEKDNFHKILKEQFDAISPDMDTAEIIFELLRKDSIDPQTAYNWALNQIKLYSHHFDNQMKNGFIATIKKVAEVYPPIEPEEKALIQQFEIDIRSI
ncbi:MAG: hypothetical protein ACK4ON_05075 [Bacteroidia bacterium]